MEKTLLFLTPRAKVEGGAEVSLLQLLRHLHEHTNYVLKVVVLEKEGPLLDELDNLGIEYSYIWSPWWVIRSWEGEDQNYQTSLDRATTQLARLAQYWNADLIYTNTSVLNVGAIAAHKVGIKHIFHIREDITANVNFRLRGTGEFSDYRKFLDSKNTGLIFISKYLRDLYGLEKADSTVIYNKVRVPEFKLTGIQIRKIDVIIPFYKDKSIWQCLESLEAHADDYLGKIIIIDDQGPDTKLRSQIKAHAMSNKERYSYLENQNNRGFVYSVNRGFKTSDRDVVILNSDTIVTKNWLAKLAQIAFQDRSGNQNVASVTPLSNSASYYTVPDPFAKKYDNDPEAMNLALENIASRLTAETHTMHGYCALITRQALDKVGLFDEKKFGRGYGEEVDFSLRALKCGFKHLVALNTFVHHWEGKSFELDPDQKEKLIREKSKLLLDEYPHLTKLEQEFHKRNDIGGIRELLKYFKDKPEIFTDRYFVTLASVDPNKGIEDAILGLAKIKPRRHLVIPLVKKRNA